MLTTKRLSLREMESQDEAVLAAYQSAPEYQRHYVEEPDARSIVTSAMDWAVEDPRSNFQYAVVLEESDTVIGCAGLRRKGLPAGEAEIGVEINPDYWRRGFAREALDALLDFGTTSLDVSVFWAETTATNLPARLLVEHCGFSNAEVRGDAIRLKLVVGE
jgi:ribosomal-protein-alanine N-acetyltransferase